jgi:hypothetical protein
VLGKKPLRPRRKSKRKKAAEAAKKVAEPPIARERSAAEGAERKDTA